MFDGSVERGHKRRKRQDLTKSSVLSDHYRFKMPILQYMLPVCPTQVSSEQKLPASLLLLYAIKRFRRLVPIFKNSNIAFEASQPLHVVGYCLIPWIVAISAVNKRPVAEQV